MKCFDIQEKLRTSIQSIYGVDNVFQSEEIKRKILLTNNERFSVDYPMQSPVVQDRMRRTMLERYGVEHYSQTEECWDRIRATCNLKYGYDYYQQSPEYYANRTWNYTNPKYPNMTFGNSWEFKVYDFLKEHHIQFEYQPEISIPYECEGTHHTYHPDFLV